MRKSYLCLAVALASLMLSLLLYVAAYSPVPDVCSPVTEAWYVYVDKQVPYGSEHVVTYAKKSWMDFGPEAE